jgi:histone deacetylase complex regulatory component SIN3
LSEPEFVSRLEKHERCRDISKLIVLYRRSIVTVSEFKKLLEPIYLSDPSFFNMLFQYAEELEDRRRRITIFAPLNELVDQKYPLEQVGNSYIIIPDGYANWGHTWQTNPLESTMNRICVSVPLGTEGSFVITRKNEFEEQLLRNEEEKYEIDSNLLSLKAAISIIERSKKLNNSLVQKVLSNIYPAEVMGVMLRGVHA